MADLAKLVVRLEAQSAQLLTELEKANGKIARFERNASGSLDKLNKKFSNFGFGVKAALGTFLGGLSFSAIVKANQEASESFSNLENSVERAGAAAGGRSAKQFAAVASQLSNLTTQSDEAVQGVQQLLLRFQNIRTDRFDEATRAVLDFSTATRRDLTSAADIVGKALANPEKGMTALAKAGVAFSETQQQVIKDLVDTGRRAEAQGLILDALGKKFGGAAEAARNNFSGALSAVNNALGELMESEDGLPGATASLNELATILQDPAVKQGADALFSAIVGGAAAAVNLIGQMAAGIGAIFGVGDAEAKIRDEIEFLEEQRDSLLPLVVNLGGQGNIFPEGGFDVIGPKKIQAKIDELTAQLEKLNGFGLAGIETMKNVKGAFDAASGAFELPDIEVVDNTEQLTEASKKLQSQLEAAGKSMTEKHLTPLERYNAEVARADELLAANVISLETWARALGAARGELGTFGHGFAEVNERFKTFDDQLREDFLATKSENADAIEEDNERASAAFAKKLEDDLEASTKAASVFAEQASRNVQDILADGIGTALHDGFSKGAKGALEAFADMLEQMALQAIAADLAGKLFGTGVGSGGGLFGGLFDSLGGGGGFFGKAFDWLGGVFGGSRDEGGRGHAGEPVMIGVGAQPEMFVPDTAGDFYPRSQWAAGGNVTQNITVVGAVSQRSARQLEVEAARRQRTATARLG